MSMDKELTSAVYAAVEKAYDHRCDIEDAADEILEIIKADRKRRGECDAPQPAKSYLKVSYDKYGDCLYVVCDSNEPARSDEDEKSILYRYAESDGRLVGITILDFMGRHAESSDDAPQPSEQVEGAQ